jgi:hypothetical protein
MILEEFPQLAKIDLLQQREGRSIWTPTTRSGVNRQYARAHFDAPSVSVLSCTFGPNLSIFSPPASWAFGGLAALVSAPDRNDVGLLAFRSAWLCWNAGFEGLRYSHVLSSCFEILGKRRKILMQSIVNYKWQRSSEFRLTHSFFPRCLKFMANNMA